MKKKLGLGAALVLSLVAGCGSAPTAETVVRTGPPRNQEVAITNYFDATTRRADPNRDIVVGAPQRGNCPMGALAGGYVGWVVPVEVRTRSSGSPVANATSYYFWFSDEVIRGVTRQLDVCP